MTANIFISFASVDRKVATTLCAALETRGFECWISARNILPGENFQVSIVQAIRRAKIMLLVFTANSNNSEEMTKELALASQQKLIVIPLRVEDVTPNDAFAYEFATRQWIDFFADWEFAMDQLSQRIANALGGGKADAISPMALSVTSDPQAARSLELSEDVAQAPVPTETATGPEAAPEGLTADVAAPSMLRLKEIVARAGGVTPQADDSDAEATYDAEPVVEAKPPSKVLYHLALAGAVAIVVAGVAVTVPALMRPKAQANPAMQAQAKPPMLAVATLQATPIVQPADTTQEPPAAGAVEEEKPVAVVKRKPRKVETRIETDIPY
ncbi:MAG TPA: toll/interleukin-1 receptor domain-containing protein [Phenylobacterium sp.]|nr:toll/interleukin-1 receptor domain-containing protein [Phenylobacterium sp.]